jgi:hypothetical protein
MSSTGSGTRAMFKTEEEQWGRVEGPRLPVMGNANCRCGANDQPVPRIDITIEIRNIFDSLTQKERMDRQSSKSRNT